MSPRRRIVDSEEVAMGLVSTFKDRSWEHRESLPFSWPAQLQNIGDSLAVAYSSDKWKPKGKDGKREQELYKHLAESRNQAYVQPGLLKNYNSPGSTWPVIGPKVTFDDCPMPRHFAILGLFEEVDLKLYTAGSNDKPRFVEGDGIVKVTVRHGMLGASMMRWSSEDSSERDEPFLFVYTRSSGVLMIITGDELDIEKDGIVG